MNAKEQKIRTIRGGSGKITIYERCVIKKVEMSCDGKDFVYPSPLNEVIVLSRLDHPNIIKLHSRSVKIVNGKLIFELERMPMDLSQLISEQNPPSEILYKLGDEMIKAVGYLHSFDIIHGDISTSNFLVSSENSIKLADFGTSFYAPYTSKVGESSGKRSYDAPECYFFEDDWDSPALLKLKKREAWALGICFVSMFNRGQIPDWRTECGMKFPETFPGPKRFGRLKEEKRTEIIEFIEALLKISTLKEEIRGLLRFYPKQRHFVSDLVLKYNQEPRGDNRFELIPGREVSTDIDTWVTEIANELNLDKSDDGVLTTITPIVWNYHGVETKAPGCDFKLDTNILASIIKLLVK